MYGAAMNITLIATVVSAAAGFGLAWNLQAHQLTKKDLNHAQERIEIQRAARLVADRASTAVIRAQNDAAGRAVVLRRDADAARTAASGLRDEIATSMRAANASHDACTVAARTSGELLTVCANRYYELAEKAQSHVSDIRTLVDAWPK